MDEAGIGKLMVVAGMIEPGQSDGLTPDPATYPGYRFSAEIISHAVWLCDTWHLDEVFLRINGVLHDLWRAVDQHEVALDILIKDRWNGSAAKRFLKRLLAALKYKPHRLV
jgi:putative transposase